MRAAYLHHHHPDFITEVVPLLDIVENPCTTPTTCLGNSQIVIFQQFIPLHSNFQCTVSGALQLLQEDNPQYKLNSIEVWVVTFLFGGWSSQLWVQMLTFTMCLCITNAAFQITICLSYHAVRTYQQACILNLMLIMALMLFLVLYFCYYTSLYTMTVGLVLWRIMLSILRQNTIFVHLILWLLFI